MRLSLSQCLGLDASESESVPGSEPSVQPSPATGVSAIAPVYACIRVSL